MERQPFESLVREALGTVPERFQPYLENVDVIVEDWPLQDQLAGHLVDDNDLLLGLYEGVPLTERADYLTVLPDRITIFQKSIEAICETNDQIVDEVRTTVVHEIAHHVGIDDVRLEELGI